MEGWQRLQEEKDINKNKKKKSTETIEEDLTIIEEGTRRQEQKRPAEQDIMESNPPKKRRKTKFPRLDGWGEVGVEEQDNVHQTTLTVQCTLSQLEQELVKLSGA